MSEDDPLVTYDTHIARALKIGCSALYFPKEKADKKTITRRWEFTAVHKQVASYLGASPQSARQVDFASHVDQIFST